MTTLCYHGDLKFPSHESLRILIHAIYMVHEAIPHKRCQYNESRDGVVMRSADGNLQFVCPVGILQRERMEG